MQRDEIFVAKLTNLNPFHLRLWRNGKGTVRQNYFFCNYFAALRLFQTCWNFRS